MIVAVVKKLFFREVKPKIINHRHCRNFTRNNFGRLSQKKLVKQGKRF